MTRPTDTFTAADSGYMARALRLAAKGRYSAHPNPMVGCVLVQGAAVVGEGFHAQTGQAHAEINALNEAGAAAKGATAYVTLEPCAHHGRTPPCADALADAGVRAVVVAMEDPNDAVRGKGLKRLRDAGIDVRTGLMQQQAAALNSGFFMRMTAGRPFVRVKMACSLDGKIAMANGQSQWITGPAARADVQRLRAASGAIMTGIGTVLADDPSLTVRESALNPLDRQPLRVIVDSQLRMPLSSEMLALPGETLIVCKHDARRADVEAAGAEVLCQPNEDPAVDLGALMTELGAREINTLLVEAGPTLAGSLLDENLVDELVIYQAPHVMGSETMGLFATPGWQELADRRTLQIRDVRRVAADTRITAEIAR